MSNIGNDLNKRSELLLDVINKVEHMDAEDNAKFVIEFCKFTDAIKPLHTKYCLGEKSNFIMKL